MRPLIGLRKRVRKGAYQGDSHENYEVLGDGDVVSVEKEWEKFRDIVKVRTNDVYDMRSVAGQRNYIFFFTEEVDVAVAE